MGIHPTGSSPEDFRITPQPPLRVRLEQALERLGLGRWKNEESRVRMTRDEFLDLVADLIRDDTEIRARQLDVEQMFERRREGAALAVLAMVEAGVLNTRASAEVRHWKSDQLAGYPDLTLNDVSIIPPDPSS